MMKKILVAYFSASGVTKAVAEKLGKEIGADLFEIQAKIPYTAADLNWLNNKSRSSVEMNDRHCRPIIDGTVENMAQYDIIFVGFPIWWYREPSIIDTFMESYDFSGKTIVPFATSGGSGMGTSGKNIASMAPSADVADGKLFKESVSKENIYDWASQWLSSVE